MFDDLKQDNTQPITTLQNQEPVVKEQAPTNSVAKPANIADMFGDVDPVASEHGPVDPNKPSAIQSGKIKPISQTSIPNNETTSQNAVVPQVQQTTAMPNIPPADAMMITDSRSSGVVKKIIIAVLVIFLLAIAGGGVYYFFLRDNGIVIEVNENQNINEDIVVENTNENVEEIINSPVINEDDLDDDFDGLSNGLEKIYGTNPLEADSDNDGVFDQDEIEIYRTDPLVDDSDGDGLSDYEEIIVYGTDPNDPDTDRDNFSDSVEISNGYNPLGDGKLDDIIDQDNLNTNENI